MKILVTSDTHGMYDDISDYILSHEDIDLVIHAGDGVEDVKYIGYETGIKYYVVKGNNDYFEKAPLEEVIDIGDKKIFLTHGHKYDVYFTFEKIIKKAKSLGCDIGIFGHIHQYINEYKDGILLLNPSSPSLSRDGSNSFIILEINDTIKVNRVIIE
ncbi:MAG: metallophosphoesterase [Anaerococcus sp.]|nr:metallophosphoesterase [Anaerococcus sp.]